MIRRVFRTRSVKLVLSSWVVVVFSQCPKGFLFTVSSVEESIFVGVLISVMNSDLSGP